MNDRPTSKRHLVIDDDVWFYLHQMYDRHYGVKPIGVSRAVRAILRKHVNRLKAKEEEMLNERDVEGV